MTGLFSPHAGETVFHPLASPKEVEHSQILQHGHTREHLICTNVCIDHGNKVKTII